MSKYQEYVNEINEFDNWMKISKELNDIVDSTSKKLNVFSNSDPNYKNEMGLTSDAVKSSSEFKKLNNDFNLAFNKLKTFNKKSPKDFKRKASKLRRKY